MILKEVASDIACYISLGDGLCVVKLHLIRSNCLLAHLAFQVACPTLDITIWL